MRGKVGCLYKINLILIVQAGLKISEDLSIITQKGRKFVPNKQFSKYYKDDS